jgi:hypothetical protein
VPEKVTYRLGEGVSRRFGAVRTGVTDLRDVTVTGEGVPTVHLADVMTRGETRNLLRPARIEVDGHVGTVRRRGRLGVTRAGLALLVDVAGRSWELRRRGVLRVVLTRVGHGTVTHQNQAGIVIHDRADALDVAVAFALMRGVDREAVSVIPSL